MTWQARLYNHCRFVLKIDCKFYMLAITVHSYYKMAVVYKAILSLKTFEINKVSQKRRGGGEEIGKRIKTFIQDKISFSDGHSQLSGIF